MANQYEQENILDPYTRQLNLTWPLATEVSDRVVTASMATDGSTRSHRLLIPTHQHGQIEQYRGEVLSMLCRAKLGETRDPLFSTVALDPQLERYDNFAEIAATINLLQTPVEVWAADLMARIDKPALEKETTDMLRHIGGLASVHLQQMPGQAFIGYAVNHADMVRHGFTQLVPFDAMALQKIRTSFGEQTAAVAQNLGEYYANLPQLPTNSDDALQALEDVTQYTARAVGLNATPIIKSIGDRHVWTLAEIQ